MWQIGREKTKKRAKYIKSTKEKKRGTKKMMEREKEKLCELEKREKKEEKKKKKFCLLAFASVQVKVAKEED